jgi:hypothetical protein
MTLIILQNSVLGPDLKLGSNGNAKDYVEVSMAHISTRKMTVHMSCVRTGMSANIAYCSTD